MRNMSTFKQGLTQTLQQTQPKICWT